MRHLIFHEGNITERHQRLLRRLSPQMDIEFISLDAFFTSFRLSESQPTDVRCEETSLSERFPAGYRAMCAFWTNEFIAWVNDFDILFRVDEDCFIETIAFRQIVDDMEHGAIDYVTPLLQGADHPDVTRGFVEYVTEWHQNHPGTAPPDFESNPYTNVFVLRLDAVRGDEQIMAFLQDVRQTHCIFQARWGDLPIWGSALSLFRARLKLKVDPTIGYFHQSHSLRVRHGIGGKKSIFS